MFFLFFANGDGMENALSSKFRKVGPKCAPWVQRTWAQGLWDHGKSIRILCNLQYISLTSTIYIYIYMAANFVPIFEKRMTDKIPMVFHISFKPHQYGISYFIPKAPFWAGDFSATQSYCGSVDPVEGTLLAAPQGCHKCIVWSLSLSLSILIDAIGRANSMAALVVKIRCN